VQVQSAILEQGTLLENPNKIATASGQQQLAKESCRGLKSVDFDFWLRHVSARTAPQLHLRVPLSRPESTTRLQQMRFNRCV